MTDGLRGSHAVTGRSNIRLQPDGGWRDREPPRLKRQRSAGGELASKSTAPPTCTRPGWQVALAAHLVIPAERTAAKIDAKIYDLDVV